MTKKIIPRPDASEEHLAIIGSLREAIDVPAKLHLLINLRSSYKPNREWSREEQYFMDHHRSPLLPKLIASLGAAGVSLRDTVFLFALCATDQSLSWGLCAGLWEPTPRANKRKT